MAVAFKGIGTQAVLNDNSGTTHPTAFSSNVEGDFLLACCACSNGSPNLNPATTWNAETGWTAMAANVWASATAGNTTFFYRFAPAGGIASQTFDTAASTGSVTVGLVFTGVDTTTPIDVGPFFQNHTSGTFTTASPPDYTTTIDDCMGIVSMNRDAAPVTITFPSGYDDRIQTGSNQPGDGCINCIGTQLHTSSGLQQPGDFSWTGAQERCSMSFALRAAPVGGNYTQRQFQSRDDDANEASSTVLDAIGTIADTYAQEDDTNVRPRFLVTEEDDVAEDDVQFQLQYNKNAGGWNDVNGSSTNVRSSLSSNFADGDDTTQQMGSGTYITNNDCMDEVNGLVGGANLDFTVTVDQEVETEHCVQIRSADTVQGDSIQLRLVKEADVDLGTYTVTPTYLVGIGLFDQTSFRGRNDDGNETTATWKAAVNTNWGQPMDENFRVRFLVQETTDRACANVALQLQYSLNGGTWTDVAAASSVVRSSASPNVTDAADTTQQIGSGTYVSTNAGFDEVDGIVGGANLDFSTTVNQEVEVEFCAQLRSADVAVDDQIQLRLLDDAGPVKFDTRTSTPTITAQPVTAWVMSLSAEFVDGDPTTRQLTDLGTTFNPGEIKEDDGATAADTLQATEFLEHEYCMQATADSINLGQYEFRLVDVTQAGEKLEAYPQIAKITIVA